LVNQQVVHELLALQMLALFLENPTEDSIEIATDFMMEVGHVLSESSPAGVSAIFERFRNILQDGNVNRRCQYAIEKLFKVRKSKFSAYPGIVPELDLVEEDDRITHEISLDDDDLGSKENIQDKCNVFQFDPEFSKNEEEWELIKKEVLGDVQVDQAEDDDEISESNIQNGAVMQMEEPVEETQIQDMTEKDLINLRRTIYLVIMSSVDFEECTHKLLKLNIREGQQLELCTMLLECCMQERTYARFYGLTAQRLCQVAEVYQHKLS